MVKTNKKSLIAMIAMVVLLIASIAMGITGAWFTDTKQSTDQTVTFGEIKLGTYTLTNLGSVYMPGDKIDTFGSITYTGAQDAYYRVTYVFTDNVGSEIAAGDLSKAYYGEIQKDGVIDLKGLEIPESLTNSYQTKSVTVKAQVDVIQKANLTLDKDSGKLTNSAGTEVAWTTCVAA